MDKKVFLKKNEEHRISQGHLWVFSNEILKTDADINIGEVVSVYSFNGKFLGVGFFNPHSLISVRFFSKEQIEFDKNFIQQKIETALSLRKILFPNSNVYRLIHSESDGLPGLIIDRFDDYFTIQTFSAGIENKLNLVTEILIEMFNPVSIIERNESQLRKLEGLQEKTGFLFGNNSTTQIELENIKYEIDLLNGQKTGFFLDQRINRNSIIPFCKDKEVLDCFCNEGGFALTASKNGAKNTIAVDTSQETIKRVEKNILLNSLQNVSTKIIDVFELLKIYDLEKRKFDLIILDPPSFTKSRKNVSTAKKGYFEINSNALKILNFGGFLATASCSHHIEKEVFLEIIKDSATKIGKTLQLLNFSGAAADHPVLPAMSETSYLKFAIFRVI